MSLKSRALANQGRAVCSKLKHPLCMPLSLSQVKALGRVEFFIRYLFVCMHIYIVLSVCINVEVEK